MLEVTGVVNSASALTEESCCPFSDNFGALRTCGAPLGVGGCAPLRMHHAPPLATLEPQPAQRLNLCPPPHPPHTSPDMANYNELCKLANGQQYRHMFLP